ncbi:hypothetical protein BsWGS_09072 [Bradybaena similaris]
MKKNVLCWRLFSKYKHLRGRPVVCHLSTSACSKPYFVTTPIFYVNAAPHIGHLYSCLLGDASTRWRRVKGETTLFATGTDEHGLKVQQAAASANLEPQVFCDKVSRKFQSTFDAAGIQYDTFMRTTDPAHRTAVHAFWNKLVEAGHIYHGSYAGWYSVPDEAFLSEDDTEDRTLADGSTVKVSKESGHPVSWTEEKNYMFRLSEFQQELLYWLNSSPIHPIQFEQIVRRDIQNLTDLSVTRDRHRLPWGIAVPGDETQTIYVWLDALVNYLTASGYPNTKVWPPDCQIIGKDILRFHAVYWPAFLIAAGLEPPSKLIVHSHWLVDNVKMSKSLGNVVDPMEKISEFSLDGLRYFMLREGSLDSDGSYSEKRVIERVNCDLANTLGNLLGRCTAPAVNKEQQLPPLVEDNLFEFLSPQDREAHKSLYALPDSVDHLYQDYHFTKAMDLVMSQLHWANAFVQLHKPWELSKFNSPSDSAQLLTVLHVAMETLRVCGILLQPIVPDLSDRLLTRLGVPVYERQYSDAQRPATSGYQLLGDKIVLQKKVGQS